MRDLVFVTNNKHKIKEISLLINDLFRLISLADIGCFEDIKEDADSLEGNAYLKAHYVHEKYGYDCFADDTGLEIAALNDRPGVYSARYAGEPPNFEANIDRVLNELESKKNRKARFRTVIVLIINGKVLQFEGTVDGRIIESRRGTQGFGYDPIFIPDGHKMTFAEMPLSDKNIISHRAMAVEKLITFLKEMK
jgi:XTP/dITP diphosphohydrolase